MKLTSDTLVAIAAVYAALLSTLNFIRTIWPRRWWPRRLPIRVFISTDVFAGSGEFIPPASTMISPRSSNHR